MSSSLSRKSSRRKHQSRGCSLELVPLLRRPYFPLPLTSLGSGSCKEAFSSSLRRQIRLHRGRLFLKYPDPKILKIKNQHLELKQIHQPKFVGEFNCVSSSLTLLFHCIPALCSPLQDIAVCSTDCCQGQIRRFFRGHPSK